MSCAWSKQAARSLSCLTRPVCLHLLEHSKFTTPAVRRQQEHTVAFNHCFAQKTTRVGRGTCRKLQAARAVVKLGMITAQAVRSATDTGGSDHSTRRRRRHGGFGEGSPGELAGTGSPRVSPGRSQRRKLVTFDVHLVRRGACHSVISSVRPSISVHIGPVGQLYNMTVHEHVRAA
jgi:hypothetical protein